ncbi:unnamed protein product [Dibothriocephalus latus]|uniref:Receptor ligand binding region domain-containing protein n=1 Tax=Dibothriocephalus latus TaxID=60516 RepID=A0A3P6P4D5_DIBLA|nr:unnamed protein product [Dibothriocephalus latus]
MKSVALFSIFLLLVFQHECATAPPSGTSKLRLMFFQPSMHCLLETRVFEVFHSLMAAVKYSRKHTEGLIKEGDVQPFVKLILGCSLTEKHRMQEIVRFLKLIASDIEDFKGYTVYIGPQRGSMCALISDWVAQSKLVRAAYASLRQINYACATDGFVRFYSKIPPKRNNTDLLNNLASVTISIPSEELYKSLNIFLRQQGWKNIAILYESSELALENEAIGQTIAYLLSNAGDIKLNVILQASVQRDSDPVRIVSGLTVNCHAIFLIAHTSIGGFFLSKVKDMPIFQNGQVAIVIFDPGNVITYDSLRLWKRVLEEEPNIGAAGQSVFLMTGLSSSFGFDMKSEVLNSVGLRG